MPQKNPSKPRAPERDYSHRTLAEKLGIKPGWESKTPNSSEISKLSFRITREAIASATRT
jgi:hypothetical protein